MLVQLLVIFTHHCLHCLCHWIVSGLWLIDENIKAKHAPKTNRFNFANSFWWYAANMTNGWLGACLVSGRWHQWHQWHPIWAIITMQACAIFKPRLWKHNKNHHFQMSNWLICDKKLRKILFVKLNLPHGCVLTAFADDLVLQCWATSMTFLETIMFSINVQFGHWTRKLVWFFNLKLYSHYHLPRKRYNFSTN